MSGPQVLFFCQRKFHGGLEQVPLNGDRECAALQLRQAARNGEAETAALRAAGGITADKLAAGVIPTVPKAAYVADPAGDTPTKAEYVALRDALVTAGLMRPEA